MDNALGGAVDWLGEVQRVQIGPDDVIVLSCPGCLSPVMRRNLIESIGSLTGSRKCLIVEQGLRIGAMGPGRVEQRVLGEFDYVGEAHNPPAGGTDMQSPFRVADIDTPARQSRPKELYSALPWLYCWRGIVPSAEKVSRK